MAWKADCSMATNRQESSEAAAQPTSHLRSKALEPLVIRSLGVFLWNPRERQRRSRPSVFSEDFWNLGDFRFSVFFQFLSFVTLFPGISGQPAGQLDSRPAGQPAGRPAGWPAGQLAGGPVGRPEIPGKQGKLTNNLKKTENRKSPKTQNSCEKTLGRERHCRSRGFH